MTSPVNSSSVQSPLASHDQTLAEAPARISDAFLLKQFLRGRDETAFAELVGRHRQTVWNVCRRILQQDQDAEDAFQAVFLVLARKAASIAKVDAVGSWLYGVAYRTAMKARQSAAIRQVREKESTPSAQEQAAWSTAACRELQQILDEELLALPVKFRAPFVLCCLQGMSKSEAAEELGWKEGSVSGRLALARKLLQNRLARRGVALSAALMATALAPAPLLAASTSLSVALTVQAVLAPAAVQAGTVTPAAATLAHGMIQAMAIAQFKGVAAAALLALAALAGGVGVIATLPSAQPVQVGESGMLGSLGVDEAMTFQYPGISLWPVIEEQVVTLALTPDGRKLITTGSRSTAPCPLIIWDVADGKRLATQSGIPGTRCIAMAPDGKTFACGEFAGSIRLRDAETGQEIAEWKAHAVGVNAVAFSADGKWLVSGGLDKVVRVWDWKARKERWSLVGATDMIYTIAVSKNSQFAVSGGRDHIARVWDLETGKEKAILRGHAQDIESVAISSDEKTIVTASWDGVVTLWDAATGKSTGTFKEVSGQPFVGSMINTMAFSPNDDNTLAVGNAYGEIHLWDLKEKKIKATVGRHREAVSSLAWSADGKWLVSGSSDRTAKRWNAEKGELVRTFHNANRDFAPVTALAHAPDGKTVAVATADKIVRLHDAQNGAILSELKGHDEVPNCLAFSADGTMLASADTGGAVKVWDQASGREKRSLGKQSKRIEPSEIKKENKENDNNNKGDKRDRKNKEVVRDAPRPKVIVAEKMETKGRNPSDAMIHDNKEDQAQRNSKFISSLVFSPDGKVLMSASGEAVVTRWDISTGTETTPLAGSNQAIRSLALSRDGATLVVAGDAGKIDLVDLATGKSRNEISAHAGAIRALAMSENGMLASTGQDGLIKLWDLASASMLQMYHDGMGGGQLLAFSPGGRLLANGGRRGNVVVTDLLSGQVCAVVLSHEPLSRMDPSSGFKPGQRTGVTGLSFDPDGQSLLSAGSDGKALRWRGVPSIASPVNLLGHAGGTSFARFSPTGDLFATGGADGTVNVWDKALMSARPPHHVRPGSYWDVAFSPDGRTVAVGSQNQLLTIDAIKGNIQSVQSLPLPVCTVAYSPDGKYIAGGTGEWTKPEVAGECVIFDATNNAELVRLPGHKQRLLRVQFSPDGATLATSCADKIIRLWEIPSGKLKGSFPQTEGAAKGLDFLPDGTIVTANFDATIRFLDPTTFKEIRKIAAGMSLASLDVSPDGKYLITGEAPAVGNGSGRIVLWDASSGRQLTRLKGHDCRILGVAFTPEMSGLIAVGGTATSHGEVHYWDLATGEHRGSKRSLTNWIDAVAISPDGLKVATASIAGFNFWNLSWVHRERSWAAHPIGALAGLFVDGGTTLATAGSDRSIALWNPRSGERTAIMHGHKSPVRSLAALPMGKTLYSAGEDGEIKVWDLATHQETATLADSSKAMSKVVSLALAPDGKTLASGGQLKEKNSNGLLLWDLASQPPAVREIQVDGVIHSLAYSPDGAMLAASAGTDKSATVTVWDARSRRLLRTLPLEKVGAIAFSPDGKVLTAGQAKVGLGHGKIWVWDTATWVGRAEFTGHDKAVLDVPFSPEGSVIASAGQEDTINLWPIGDRDIGKPAKSRPSLAMVPALKVPRFENTDDAEAGGGGIPVWMNQGAEEEGAPAWSRLKIALAAGMVVVVGLVVVTGWVAYRQFLRKQRITTVDTVAGNSPSSIAGGLASKEDPKPAAKEKADATTFSISIPCSRCGKVLKGNEGLIGKKVKCPHCQTMLVFQGKVG